MSMKKDCIHYMIILKPVYGSENQEVQDKTEQPACRRGKFLADSCPPNCELYERFVLYE